MQKEIKTFEITSLDIAREIYIQNNGDAIGFPYAPVYIDYQKFFRRC